MTPDVPDEEAGGAGTGGGAGGEGVGGAEVGRGGGGLGEAGGQGGALSPSLQGGGEEELAGKRCRELCRLVGGAGRVYNNCRRSRERFRRYIQIV